MENFRFKVFRTVAKNLSFTKAANELFISQPAITKHIQAIENEYGLRLFNRNGSKIYLTPAGKVLYDYSNKLFNLQNELENELNSYKEKQTGSLRLGASTTIAQYVIPPILSKFHKKFPHLQLFLHNGNSNQIADMLLRGDIDLGIVEGKVKNRDIKYSKFAQDELVAVTNSKNKILSKKELSITELVGLPLVLRERGSGTLEVLEYALKSKKIKLSSLNVLLYLGSTEAIKYYIASDDCVGFISIRALKRELETNELKIIKVKNFKVNRTFSFISLHGKTPAGATGEFIKFAKREINF